jgi:hypothetical protein
MKANTDGSVTVTSAGGWKRVTDGVACVWRCEFGSVGHDKSVVELPRLGLTLKWSHIYREGNAWADNFGNDGHVYTQMRWWDSLPALLRDDFLRDKLGLSFGFLGKA